MVKIKSAAIKTKDGRVFVGRSHAEIFQMMKDCGVVCNRGCVQGFVTDTGIGDFVDRKEAAQIAFDAGQTNRLESVLFSEDLTGDWPWAKKEKQDDS
jgi:hypothetical protein